MLQPRSQGLLRFQDGGGGGEDLRRHLESGVDPGNEVVDVVVTSFPVIYPKLVTSGVDRERKLKGMVSTEQLQRENF